jgi:adenine-specific DNA-methyltransferase
MDAAQQAQPPEQLKARLLALLPDDHSAVGNISLLTRLQAHAREAGLNPITEDDFKAARDALVASSQAVKGKGRGGSLARATGSQRPEFVLKPREVTSDLLTASAPTAAARRTTKPANPKPVPQATSGDAQVLAYRHANRRKNNPEVGLVNTASDPEQAKTTYAYDPHLDPALQWAGKAERTSFAVDTVSLHVHERIDAMNILSAVSKRQGQGHAENATKTGAINPYGTRAGGLNNYQGFEHSLFEAPFESLPLRAAVHFYKHDRGWAERSGFPGARCR